MQDATRERFARTADRIAALQDARAEELEAKVVGDRVWAAVVAGVSELSTEANDRGLNLGRGCVGAGTWSS